MNKKQVEEVIKAIIDHKYSWACVLILRFHGYDPIDYIPYRTYIRLLKDNYQLQKKDTSDTSVKTVDFNDFKSNKMHLVEQKKC
ncbi:HetP family heterocyst commitment protein [Plectonema cf. radiosum LEGE 06105]|uniref:HetP family heterocyst commitment protein n=1 Tax=Plectonema cf. radiosum LEGE 06105 TaxID=945769 RepID=A0A8J7JY77_9CYAN|nr:HetP family heterocyst commitment protein [Plectonema radiosum]MBE9211267.1 HetP family heterocyst commitment protein [Plectonema cf. radiosum LEGE 06105]